MSSKDIDEGLNGFFICVLADNDFCPFKTNVFKEKVEF